MGIGVEISSSAPYTVVFGVFTANAPTIPDLWITVRLKASGCGTGVQAQAYNGVGVVGAGYVDPLFGAACAGTTSPTTVGVSPALAPRQGTGASTALTLSGIVGGTPNIPVDFVAETAQAFEAIFACRLTEPAGQSFAPCEVAGAMNGFARLTASDGSSLQFPLHSFPGVIYLQPSNDQRPSAGGVELRIDLDGDQDASNALLTRIAVEKPPAQFAVAVQPTEFIAVASPTPAATLQVTKAVNDVGGNEPPTATWSFLSAEFVTAAGASQNASGIIPAASAPDRWLSSEATTPSANPVTITVPKSTDLAFPANAAKLVVHYQATHTVSPPSPTATTTASVDFTVKPQGSLPSDRCEIWVRDATLGVQGQTEIGLNHIQGSSPPTPMTLVHWALPNGSGEIVPAGAGYVYRAPKLVPDPPVVLINATHPVCPGSIAPAQISIVDLVHLELVVDKKNVTSGSVVHLTGKVSAVAKANGLRFQVALDRMLKPVRRMPQGRGGLVVRKLDTPIDATDSAFVVQPATEAFGFSADLAAGQHGEFSLPVLVRAAGAGVTVKADVYAFYSADQVIPGVGAIAHAHQEITIVADPEFTEATLIGKVFHDKNGDGKQQPGEEGLAKAMVAVSSGVYALTDEQGRYHIPRLEPGRHAVKVNPSTLPLGAAFTTDARREVTLTPGGFVRVSFGVRLPDLQDGGIIGFLAAESSMTIANGKPAYRARFAVEAGRVLSAEQGGRSVLGHRMGEHWELLLPLAVEAPFWTLIERAADGRAWLSAFGLYVYARPGEGALVVPWGPRPIARLVLPPPERSLQSDKLVLVGELTSPALMKITAASDAGECEAILTAKAGGMKPAAVRCDLRPRVKIDAISVALEPTADEQGVAPPRATLALPVVVEPAVHFLVGLAGVEGSALLERAKGENPWFADAGGEFFYRGVVNGDWLVTAGADASVRDLALKKEHGKLALRRWGGFAKRLLAHDPRRVFRDLDPEAYYPTYGDESVTVDERESGGRFFFRVEHGQSFLKWGGVNTAIDDAEVGRYVRSFYGLGGRLSLGDAKDELKLRGVLFAAQPDSLAARDELLVAGGTLYFLGHHDLVEGSLRVTLEMLDEVSGLPIRATPLVEGVDYVADHVSGRIVLDSALGYRAFGTSLTADGAGGVRARLLVEYEYLPEANNARDYALGARVVGTWGPVSLGMTGVSELLGNGADGTGETAKLKTRYSLLGATGRLDLAEALTARLELAHSEGGSHDMGRSTDGGLTFSPRTLADAQKGSAAALELSTGLLGTHTGVYGRYQEPGFSDSHTPPGMRLLQGGLRLDGTFTTGTKVWGNVDYRETTLTDATGALHSATTSATGTKTLRDLGLIGASQRLGDFKLSTEGRYEGDPVASTRRVLVGAQVGYHLTSSVALSMRRRQLVSADAATRAGSPAGESALGAELVDVGALDLLVEAGLSDDRSVFGRAQGSIPVADDTELYAGYRVASRLRVEDPTAQPVPGDGVVVGGRRTMDNGALLYSEQNLRVDGGERTLTRTVGGQVPLTKRTAVSLTYERGALDRDDTSTGTIRDALSLGGSFVGERVSLRLVGDGRLDQLPSNRSAEVGCQGRLEVRPGSGWVVALAGRGGSAFDGGHNLKLVTAKRAWEGSLGVAMRPVDVDWIDLFARYALEYERLRDPTSSDWTATLSQIISGAAVVDLVGPVAFSPKVAYRNTRLEVEEGQATDQALLVALRGDLHLSQGWDASLEGRSCSVPQSQIPTQFGALAEVSLLTLDWLRLGAGYNFSRISAYSVTCNEAGARGLFIRAEAIY